MAKNLIRRITVIWCHNLFLELSDEVVLSLFELVCFYNCESPLDEDLMHEKWYMTQDSDQGQRNTWK